LPLRSKQLVEFLEEVEENLPRSIVLVAAGGTAMTLHKFKPSTIDVDFTGPWEDIEVFKKAVSLVQPGFRVDCFDDGQVFSQGLPADYLQKSILIKKMKRIELRALSPVDIVVTKLGRYDERDGEDIGTCIKRCGLKKQAIIQRARRVQIGGNERLYRDKVDSAIRDFFPA
jgi:hypothetical protein